jgi:ABC-type amino acid transport substrate-binding protein
MYKKIVQLIFILISALLFFGCDSIPSQPVVDTNLPARLQEIQQNEKIVIGTAITRPFEYRDETTNELIGFDISLMEDMLEPLGVSIEWREMAFADLIGELEAGNIDLVIAAMYITEAREEIVDFSQPYLDTGLIMVVHRDSTDIQSIEDLVGHTIAVKEGSTGERWAENWQTENNTELELRHYTDTIDSLNDLNDGLVDIAFNDYLNTLEYMKTHPNVHTQGEIFAPAGLGIAVQAGDEELLTFVNNSLDEMQENGKITELFDLWINPEIQQ